MHLIVVFECFRCFCCHQIACFLAWYAIGLLEEICLLPSWEPAEINFKMRENKQTYLILIANCGIV